MADEKVNLLQYGIGKVGRPLAQLVLAHGEQLALHYIALVDSSGVIWAPEGMPNAMLAELVASKERGERLVDHSLGRGHQEVSLIREAAKLQGPTVLVDCTASTEMTPHLIESRRRGLHVVLANKLPLVGPLADYRALTGPAPGALRYEVTVGAGLPIIRTVEALLVTGDELQHIEGCFSGTLGYLFSRLEEGVPFSSAVREAWELGYTEPDPREDLAGWDVARKALILARRVGYELELSQVAVEPLFPEEMAAVSVEDFMRDIADLDGVYGERLSKAQAAEKVLRYVAQVSDGACRVGLMEVARQGRLGSLHGPENIVVLHTLRYDEVPLTIAGPGAGPEVTAAGVLSDILDMVRKG
jgi:homoserine dehydrogenase